MCRRIPDSYRMQRKLFYEALEQRQLRILTLVYLLLTLSTFESSYKKVREYCNFRKCYCLANG